MPLYVTDPVTAELICVALEGEFFRFMGTSPTTEILVTPTGVELKQGLVILEGKGERDFELAGRQFSYRTETR